MKRFIFLPSLLFSLALLSQSTVTISLHPDDAKNTIPKEIYGQFAEHLGTCIYGGIWVGENSKIPNTNGYRNDVLKALKDLHVPVLRWPGGCFADEYHWMDGVGRRENRPKMVNTNWGGVVEDNSFGTHEFLNLCEMIGCEPYISGNVGSGTVEELSKWVEYMTSDADSPMANLRRKNGRDKPWKVKYLGVGNESWGCGGNMTADYYSDLYRRYSTYCREYGENRLFKIASGASDYDYKWTETLMNKIGNRMSGISLHYYTCKGWWGSKGSATNFTTDEYLWTLLKSSEIEDVIKKHIAIMDKYDPQKSVALLVDEWGTWWDQEPGSHPGFLYQQNTMRDAIVAAISLNIFHKYTDRIKMTNIAQIINVLQAMILTNGDKMVLTPTYHVFKMFQPHQESVNIPLDIQCNPLKYKEKDISTISVSASKTQDGNIFITMANVDLEHTQNATIDLGNRVAKRININILTATSISSYNTFEQPNNVKPTEFKDYKLNGKTISLNLPPKSILAIMVQK